MIIIGLTGSIGSGKTTFAEHLADQFDRTGHWESWQLIAEVAEALRAVALPQPVSGELVDINEWLRALPGIVQDVCHKSVSFEDIMLKDNVVTTSSEYIKLFQYLKLIAERPELADGPITPERKEAFRPILQWLGGYLADRCGGDVWYAEIIRRIKDEPDLELATIGGVRFPADAACVKQAAGFMVMIDRPSIQSRDLTDPTERERVDITIDSTVYNNGDLMQLESCAVAMAHDLVTGELAPEYNAAQKRKH